MGFERRGASGKWLAPSISIGAFRGMHIFICAHSTLKQALVHLTPETEH